MHPVAAAACRVVLTAFAVCHSFAVPGGAQTPDAGGVPLVTISARLVRDSVTISKTTFPIWKAEITYENTSTEALQLGDTLLLVMPSPAGGTGISVHVVRELASPMKSASRPGDRFGTTWGIEIPHVGAALWPFTALPGIDTLTGLTLTIMAEDVDARPGGGFGPALEPGERRTITDTVIIPFNIEVKGAREAIVLVPPTVRPAGGGPGRPPSILVFDVRGLVENGASFETRNADVLPADPAALRAIIADGTLPPWRRLVALNWFAEAYPDQAADPLVALASDTAPVAVLRRSAILNLGARRVPGALPVLVERAAGPTAPARLAAIAALGDYGDPSAAPPLRPLVRDKDTRLAGFAIRTLGALKDVESAPMLSAALNTKGAPQAAAADALVAMEHDAARDILTGTLRNRRIERDTRETVIAALQRAGAPWATAAIASVALDEQDNDDVRVRAIRALGGLNDGESLEALRTAAQSRKKKVNEAAKSAIGRREKRAGAGVTN
jgi:HEAT repeat protein